MGYVYQADVYCDDCGERICSEIRAQGIAPEDFMDHSSYDSDDFPKSYDHKNDESDTPEHCAKCHEFLYNPLTSAGYAYVQAALNDLPALTSIGKLVGGNHEFLATWANWYDFQYLDAEDCADEMTGRLPGWYSREAF